MIRIVLVDDHEVLREALREKLDREADLEVVGEASTIDETLTSVKCLCPDVLVLDVSLGDENGTDIVGDVLISSPATRIIAFSMYADGYHIKEMLRAGADGYVTKTASKTDLLEGIRDVARGNQYFCREASAALVSGLRREEADNAGLTSRERQVLKLLAEGKRSATIAELLSISPGTVEVHRRNIMHKLELHTIAELTHYAIRHDITPL